MDNEPCWRTDERLDDLQNNGLRILQKPGGFRFGMDSVLLAHFTRLRKRDHVADLGTGTGILPLLMSQIEPTATFSAFEWQPDMAELAKRNAAMNGLEKRIRIYADDLRDAPKLLGYERVHAVVCNPPYGRQGGLMQNRSEPLRLSRHETDCPLSELIKTCGAILRNQGRLWMCFPAERALELIDAMRACRLEPKRVRMVCAIADKAPYLLLIEAVKNARPMLQWLPPLIVYQKDGRETEELRAIYGLRTECAQPERSLEEPKGYSCGEASDPV